MTAPIVRVSDGQVMGLTGESAVVFHSIPYAAPPVGSARFSSPIPPSSWKEVRDARAPGATAPQRNGRVRALDLEPLIGPGWVRGNDYLTLNVWMPRVPVAGAPVMLWIHGGGFVAGCKDAPIYDGTAFARDGIVCVSINYRMGVEGFLSIPGAVTNIGLRDVIAALEWVRQNIEQFGGDPANITLFGESAGAAIVADLVTSPLANPLFRRAIIQSGHAGFTRSLAVAGRVVEKLASVLKISPNLDGFRGVGAERCLDAVARISRPTAKIDLRDQEGRDPLFGISRFSPVHGDDVLPEQPLQALRNGAGTGIDVLIGTNAEEMNLYLVPLGLRSWLPRWLAIHLLGRSQPDASDVLRAYGLGSAGIRPGDALTRAMSDLVFRWPARRFAEEHWGRTHVYEFEWRSPAYGNRLGACHGLELPFVFDTLGTVTGARGLTGVSPPQGLADRVHTLWVDFARNGALPWPPYDRETRQVHQLASNATIQEAPMPAASYTL